MAIGWSFLTICGAIAGVMRDERWVGVLFFAILLVPAVAAQAVRVLRSTRELRAAGVPLNLKPHEAQQFLAARDAVDADLA